MIEPKELRIGNLIQTKFGSIVNIVAIDITSCLIEFETGKIDRRVYLELEPIELIEEWLLKCGFEKENDYMYSINKGTIDYFSIWIFSDGIYFCELSKPIKLKYVHKLQNLYFELRDKELTIK